MEPNERKQKMNLPPVPVSVVHKLGKNLRVLLTEKDYTHILVPKALRQVLRTHKYQNILPTKYINVSTVPHCPKEGSF